MTQYTHLNQTERNIIANMSASGHRLKAIAKVERKTAELVRKACIELLTPFKEHVHTITFDNGKEFADHALIDQAIGCTTYFAKPYCSWQRGSNENTNGLIRQYTPKKTSMAHIDAFLGEFVEPNKTGTEHAKTSK